MRLSLLAATLVLGVGSAAAQTATISPTTAQTLQEGEALKVTVTVNDVTAGHEASIDFPAAGRTVSLADFAVYQQANEPTGSDTPVTLVDGGAGHYFYVFATNSDPAGPVTFWVLAKTDTVVLEGDETLVLNGGIYNSSTLAQIAVSSNLTVTLTDATPIPAPTGKPTTPANLTAAAGKGAVTLTWDAIDDTSSNTNLVNDVQITKHQVRQTTDNDISDETWDDIPNSALNGINANTYTIGSLTDGTEYTFQVRAVNGCTTTAGCGNSDPATAVMATPDAEALAQPTGLTATAGNTEITLTWTDPGNDAILYYEYQQKEGLAAFGAWTEIFGSSATTTSYRLTGLDNGTAYSYRIRAGGAGFTSLASDAVTATPRGAPPAAPVLTATPRNGAVTLSWPNPVDASLTAYEYQYKIGAGVYQPWRVAREPVGCFGFGRFFDVCRPPYLYPGATLQFSVGGLTNGTPHTFRIRAVNADGRTNSNEATATPVAGVPAKPTGLTTRLNEDGDRRILEWDRVADAGILRYEYTTDEGRTWSLLPLDSLSSGSPTGSKSTLPRDQFLSGYTFRIRAVNAAGPGPASEPAVEEETETVVTRFFVRTASLEWDATTRKATLVWDRTAPANLRRWYIRGNRTEHGTSLNGDVPIGTPRYELPGTYNAGDLIAVWIVGCVTDSCVRFFASEGFSNHLELRFRVGAPNTVPYGVFRHPGRRAGHARLGRLSDGQRHHPLRV